MPLREGTVAHTRPSSVLAQSPEALMRLVAHSGINAWRTCAWLVIQALICSSANCFGSPPPAIMNLFTIPLVASLSYPANNNKRAIAGFRNCPLMTVFLILRTNAFYSKTKRS
jgi:hypothetical protein